MKKQLLFFLLLYNSISFAQSFEGEIKIENITFPDGNQLSYAYDITQDSSGLMWFRSSSDFYNYNGHTLSKVAKEVMGYTTRKLGRVHWGKSQPLFYIPADSLVLYNPLTNEHVNNSDKNLEGYFYKPGSKDTMRIGIVGAGTNGTTWGLISINRLLDNTDYSYVVKSDPKGKFQLIDSLKVSWYYDVAAVLDNEFYVKCRDRIEVFSHSGRSHVYHFEEGPDPVMPSMVIDKNKTIWVLYSPDRLKDEYAVYYLKKGQKKFSKLSDNQHFPQEEKQGEIFLTDDYLWHRGYPFSVSRMQLTDGHIEDLTMKILEQKVNFPFYKSKLLNLYEDRSGDFWMTTRSGIVKITIEQGLYSKYKHDNLGNNCTTENCEIKGITEDEYGNIYFSLEGGITKLDANTGKISPISLSIPSQKQKSHSLSYINGSLYWNEYAINLNDYSVKKVFNSAGFDYVSHAFNPKLNELWIGVNSWPFKLYCFNVETGKTREVDLPIEIFSNMNAEIRKMHYSSTTGSLFLAVWSSGILELDDQGVLLKKHNYKTSSSLETWHNNAMYDIYEDNNHQLWVGHAQEAGLSRLDLKTGAVSSYPYHLNQFTGALKRVFRILPGRDDLLWLITEKGTMSLNKSSGKLTHFPMFPSLSNTGFFGLPAYHAKNGPLYIGRQDGNLFEFNPKTIFKQSKFDENYPIVIDRYERFNEKDDSLYIELKNLKHLDKIELSYLDRYFKLRFFIPDYRNTEQNLYSYWLEGYDSKWTSPARINELRYENLPHGKYTLHIRGGLTADYLDTSERQLSIVVHQAWYKTWWAWGLYFISFVSAFYIFYTNRMRQQLEKAETLRLKELDNLKTRLYTNITHEFRTPLTVIMGMTNSIQGHPEEKILIQRNSKNLLRLINQLLDLSKLDSGSLKMDKIQGDIIEYLQYLTESFYSMAEEKQVRLTFYSEIKALIMDYDEAKIQHIIYNLLTNAIKFTMEGGKVILHIKKTEKNNAEYLQMKVSDTGIGISSENIPKYLIAFFKGLDLLNFRKLEQVLV